MNKNAPDLIHNLLAISADSALANARLERDVATENTQAAFESIFFAPSKALTLAFRQFIAQHVAEVSGCTLLAEFYAQALRENSEAPNLDVPFFQAALAYVDVVTSQPKNANISLVNAMLSCGLSAADIVLLAQLTAFITYQARLLEGLRLFNGENTSHEHVAIVAGRWNQEAKTAQGQQAPTAYTTDALDWEPWLSARDAADLSEDEASVMKKFGQINSAYFLLLAHQSKILEIRTLIDRGVFYTGKGLPRWEREFAATAVSKVNGCIYCASVHARKAIQYAKERFDDVHQLLNTPAGEVLAHNFDERLLKMTALVVSLTATPTQANRSQIDDLRALGLSELELLDLIQSTAFFSWANRLMLSLGEPFEISQEGKE